MEIKPGRTRPLRKPTQNNVGTEGAGRDRRMRLMLHGEDAPAMRRMCLQWYFEPLAKLLLRGQVELPGVVLVVGAYRAPAGAAVGHRIAPAHHGKRSRPGEFLLPDLDFALRVDEARERLFGQVGNELDDQGTFRVAFASQCPHAEESTWSWERARAYAVLALDGTTSLVGQRQQDDLPVPSLQGQSLPPPADHDEFLLLLEDFMRVGALVERLERAVSSFDPPRGDREREIGRLTEATEALRAELG